MINIDDLKPQYAIYYPYPFIRNDAWLKTAALFWDKIFRIVPIDFDYAIIQDSRITHPTKTAHLFSNEFDFIKDYIVPARNFRQMSDNEFHSAAARLLEIYDHDPKWFIEEMAHYGEKYFTWGPQERGKINYFAHRFLHRNLVVGYDESYDNCGPMQLYFREFPGRVYMMLLAKCVANKLNLPIVTDDEAHADLLFKNFISERPNANLDLFAKENEGRYVSWSLEPDITAFLEIAFETIGLKDIENVDPKAIVRFRKKHDEERRAFHSEIRNFIKTFQNTIRWDDFAPDYGNKILKEIGRQMHKSLKSFESALRDVKLNTIINLTAVSATFPIGKLLSEYLPEVGPFVMAGSGGLGIAAAIYKSKKAKKAVYDDEPAAAYLHHLCDLKPKILIDRLVKKLSAFY